MWLFMILDSKQPRTVIPARTILHWCVSAFLDLPGPSDPVLGSGFKKPSANVSMYAGGATFIPLPAAYFGEKKCLTDCSHYSIQCILTGACRIKNKRFVLFNWF